MLQFATTNLFPKVKDSKLKLQSRFQIKTAIKTITSFADQETKCSPGNCELGAVGWVGTSQVNMDYSSSNK